MNFHARFHATILGVCTLVTLGYPVMSSAAETPMCEGFLSSIPVSQLRFQKPLRLVREALEHAGSLDVLVTHLTEKDARSSLFRLESLSRMYTEIYGAPFESIHKEIKAFEDALGQYTARLEYLEDSRAVQAPEEVLRELEQQAALAKQELVDFLLKKRWVAESQNGSPRLDKIEKDLLRFAWEKQKLDRKLVIRQLVADLKELEAYKFDPNELQSGIHEARRRYRWGLIAMQALDGLVLLEPSTGPAKHTNEYRYLETHPMAESSRSSLPENPRVKRPLLVPRHLYLALTKIVQELGAIKRSGEDLEALTEAFLESGLASTRRSAKEQASELLEKDQQYVKGVPGAARSLRQELKRTRLIRHLRKALEKAE